MIAVIKGRAMRPRRVLLYGTRGIGKSWWAAHAPSPVFLNLEDGLDDIDCERTPLLKSFGNVNEAISQLLTEPHGYRTVVIDTVDWLEHCIHEAVAERVGKKNIEEIGYGKGYVLALDAWSFLLKSLEHLREKGMAVILLAHAQIATFKSPDADSYNRYEPDLHKSAYSMLMEWCDEVLFATYRVNTVAREEGFNQTRVRAVGTGERIVYTSERPTHLAKRRLPLPDVMPLDFDTYAQHVFEHYQIANPEASTGSNVAGIVKNGSSKPKEKANV